MFRIERYFCDFCDYNEEEMKRFIKEHFPRLRSWKRIREEKVKAFGVPCWAIPCGGWESFICEKHLGEVLELVREFKD